MQIKGDVPKLALIDKDAPRDMIKKKLNKQYNENIFSYNFFLIGENI